MVDGTLKKWGKIFERQKVEQKIKSLINNIICQNGSKTPTLARQKWLQKLFAVLTNPGLAVFRNTVAWLALFFFAGVKASSVPTRCGLINNERPFSVQSGVKHLNSNMLH